MGARTTIYDVAREAGVAASTVSRAYSRPGRVNVETARAIFAAAERLGYRSTRITARVPAQTGAVALMVSDITNPFYGEIIKGAEEAAKTAGYALLLSDTSESGVVEREVVERTLNLVEGVVLASTRMSDSAIRMIAKQRPLVLLNRRMPDTSCIVADNDRGIRLAVEHLVELGHDDVTYVAGPAASWTEGARWRALRDVGRDLDVRIRRVDPDAVPTMVTGYNAADRVVDLGATAVLAYNDAIAIGVMKRLKERGLCVPDDVSVVGYDNVLLSEVVDPMLTTVTSPMRTAGAAGVGNVLALAAGAKTSGETLVLPVQLVVRGSTGPRSTEPRRAGQARRKSVSPARGTTSAPGSAANASGSTVAGSR